MRVFNKDKTEELTDYDVAFGYLLADKLLISNQSEGSPDYSEDILVFVPYTDEELHERELFNLRTRRRVECFSVVNRGKLWYSRLTFEQEAELAAWYDAWLNVTKTLVAPERPAWIDNATTIYSEEVL